MPGKSVRTSRKRKKRSESESESLIDSHTDLMAPRFYPIVPESLASRWAWRWAPMLHIELRNQGASILQLFSLQFKHRRVLATLCSQGVSIRTIKRLNLDDPTMCDREREARVWVHLERSAAHFAKSGKDPVNVLQNSSLLFPMARSVRFLMISLERMRNSDRDKNKEALRCRSQIDTLMQAGSQIGAQMPQKPLPAQRRIETTKPIPSPAGAETGAGLYHGMRVWRPKKGVVVPQEGEGVKVL